MSSGYSGTPLIKKLGIKDSDRVKLIHEPTEYTVWLGLDISKQFCSRNELPDFVHLFAKDNAGFEKEMLKLLSSIKPTTAIWVSWYKKSSKIPTDITEDVIRNFALKHDLVDVKVCAVSEEWSGLKLVVPIAKRKPI